jgi:uncharacterized protein DUF5063
VNDDQSKFAEDFRRTAERYCALVEKSQELDRMSFLSQLQLILPELINVAASLPQVALGNHANESEPDIDHPAPPSAEQQRWHQIYVQLESILGSDSYWDVFDSRQVGEPERASLSIDIYEIYSDMKDALALQGRQGATETLWDWRFEFHSHWGNHAVSALKAIHQIVS